MFSRERDEIREDIVCEILLVATVNPDHCPRHPSIISLEIADYPR
jgi:hypothetical protein